MDIQRKKKVLIMTDMALANTGFGKNAKNILEYLFKTDKYELVHLCVGTVNTNGPELERCPWKCIGTIQPEKIQQIQSQNDPKNWDNISRMAGYGAFAIDEAVTKEKPDVVFAIQDSWGVDFIVDDPQTHQPLPWFDKITSVIWVTLDSLPLLDKQVTLAKKSKNFWSWADFATKSLHKMGISHAKTVPGCMQTKNFYRLPQSKRTNLRSRFGIDPDTFVAGFVFRNQLRKSVPNLLQGFQIFKKEHPKQKTKLLLHTHWNEGWNIPKLMQEFGIPAGDVITTYICRNCGKYEIKPFATHEENCKFCQSTKSQVTTGPGFGVSEKDLNEIYNLMDVYVHPFTSGGLEIPCYEAKLTELPVLVTNYSCGEDLCVDGAGSLPLEWAEYREPDSMFIKSSTYPSSIAKQFKKVLAMSPESRKELGQTGRKWVIENYYVDKIGKVLEDTIDQAPFVDETTLFEKKKENSNPYYSMPEIQDDGQWILHMYKNILDKPQVDANDEGYKHWIARINKDLNRQQIEQYFRQVAYKSLQDQKGGAKFEDFLNPDDKGRVIIVQPDGPEYVFLTSALFKSIKANYPDWALYVSTKRECKEILEGNPLVDRWIEYSPIMDNVLFLEGNSVHPGFFNVAYHPHFTIEKLSSFTHNGVDKIAFPLKNTSFEPHIL